MHSAHPFYEPDPVRRDTARLLADLSAHTGLPSSTVADLRWAEVDTDRRRIRLDRPVSTDTRLSLTPELARLLYLRGCWQRLAFRRNGYPWTPQVRVFEDAPRAAA